jgi:hypothetical protein
MGVSRKKYEYSKDSQKLTEGEETLIYSPVILGL